MRTIFQVFSKQTWLRVAAAFAVFLLPLYIFVELASEVKEQDTLGFDEAILRAVNSVSSPLLDILAIVLTDLGGAIGVTAVTIGISVLLWRRGMRRRTAVLLVGVGGAVLLNLVLKSFFQRDRPELWDRLVMEHSYSFPSGHAMASSAFAFTLIVIFWPTRWRWLVVAGTLLFMVIIGLTRLYLGVHYPTDVLAGWLVSATWVAVVVAVMSYRTHLAQFLFKQRS